MVAENVVGLLGGLGNQLFQYALATALETVNARSARFDLSAFRRKPEYLGLAQLGLPLPARKGLDALPHPDGRLRRTARLTRVVMPPHRLVLERPDTTPAGLLTASAGPAWYYGYWQFTEVVRAGLPLLRDRLERLPAAVDLRVGLHVRRGDMLGAFGGDGPGYYRRAVARLDPHGDRGVLVCSDDVPWCRANLHLPGVVDYREGGRPADDLLALAACRSLALSASTFSWWAATLVPHAADEVVAPRTFPSARELRDPAWLSVAPS